MFDLCLVLAGSPPRFSRWIASYSSLNRSDATLFAVTDDMLLVHALHGLSIYS